MLDYLSELLISLNPYLGWTSLVFYVLVITVTSMGWMRKVAYLSVINDVLYGLSMGIHGWAKVTINIAVGFINTNRYVQDFTRTKGVTIYLLHILAGTSVIGIASFGLYSLATAFSFAGVLLWVDAALVIGALTVKSIHNYRVLMALSCVPAMIGYGLIGEIPMLLIKLIVGCIAIYHLGREYTSK